MTGAHEFGKYRLIGVLASGGMARLYLALMSGADRFTRVVALKQVHPHLAESPELTRMFLNEARLAAKLDHPNIVRIFELGEVDGQYFISMEYLPAEDLTRIVNESRKRKQWIPASTAAAIVQATADALQSAHDLTDDQGKSLGLVHRDVSLSNIMVTYHGLPKLADFGIAKATALPGRGTRAGTFKGKFAYAAPEQVTGKPVDSRTDVFALGIVLWELLTIRRLFKRESDAATIRAVEEAEVPPIRSIRPNVPRELEAIALKALAKRPKDRFQTATEMSDALEEVLRAEGVSSANKHLAKWLIALFGDQVANIKKGVAQGRLDMASVDAGGLGLAPEEAALIGLAPIAPKRAKAPARPDSAQGAATEMAARPEVRPRSHQPPPPPRDAVEELESKLRRSDAFITRPPSVTSSAPRAAWSTDFSMSDPFGGTRTPSQASNVPNYTESARPWSGSSSLVGPELGPAFSRARVAAAAIAVAALVAGGGIIVHRLTRSSVKPIAQVGVVRFHEVPPGARVVVDDQVIGAADSVELPVGGREVRVERDGQIILRRMIDVRSGHQTIELKE